MSDHEPGSESVPFRVPMRQIHLDFHTSEQIEGVGADFDPDRFADTLHRAHVDSIICFARCHHGWLYYDSPALPARRHPHLQARLLEEQIRACRERGISVTVYTTIQWDNLVCAEHPEWRIVHADGSLEGTPPFEAGFYRKLCLNSPFRQFIKEHARDIVTTLQFDALYFDFVRPDSCVCGHCQELMRARGLEPADPEARERFGVQTVDEFELELSALVREYDQDCGITYNGGHIGMRHRNAAPAYTHFEMETLPSGGWGYMYFPVTVRFARTLGPACVGTTGKFHSTWGDFHSLKNRAALQYECFRMLAHGAGCSIGDQLHPRGVLDPAAYELIGSVYAEVERAEPWCRGATPVAEIAVLHPEEHLGGGVMNLPPAVQGVTRMLTEGGHQFDIVDSTADLDRYSLLVLPDHIVGTTELSAKMERFVAAGGAVLASFESGLNDRKNAFASDLYGVRVTGDGGRDADGELVRGRAYHRNDFCDFVVPGPQVAGDLPQTEHATYVRGLPVEAVPGTEILAGTRLPYFDRSYQHFSSHLQAPSSGVEGGPAIVRNGRVIYLAHPVFTQYERNAPRWMKSVVLQALDLLLPEPLLRHDGPSTLEATVTSQPEQNRLMVHLLHYIPERRGADFDTVEDLIPLHGLTVSVRPDRRVRTARLEPQGVQIPVAVDGDRVRFTVDELMGHQIVCLQLEP